MSTDIALVKAPPSHFVTSVADKLNGRIFNMVSYVSVDGKVTYTTNKVKVVNGDAQILDTFQHDKRDFDVPGGAADFIIDEKEGTSGLTLSSFEINSNSYWFFRDKANNKAYVYPGILCKLALYMARIGLLCIDLPLSYVQAESQKFAYSSPEFAFNSLLEIGGLGDSDAQKVVFREILKLLTKNQKVEDITLAMSVLCSPEMISAVGSSQWVGNKDQAGKINITALGDTHLTSVSFIKENKLSLLASAGEYHLFSSGMDKRGGWLKGSHAIVKFNYDELVIEGNQFRTFGEPNRDEELRAAIKSHMPAPAYRVVGLFNLRDKVTLKNACILESLLTEHNPVITIEGENIIRVDSYSQCIRASGIVTIQGQGSLTLICGSHSSVIGAGALSQSSGRYATQWADELTKVIVDGINLIVDSEVPNFTLGTYGKDNDVQIETKNGGTVTGVPETQGKVALASVGVTSMGSTKIEGSAKYKLASASETSHPLNLPRS